MRIGEATKFRILYLCKVRKIKINKLAVMCGVQRSTLENIIKGKNKSTTISTIKKICDGLDITILDFFDDEVFKSLEPEIEKGIIDKK